MFFPFSASSHDPYYPPIVTLPEVSLPSGEEEEETLLKMRAKLFRYHPGGTDEDDPPLWKERGTGDVKILKHKQTGQKVKMGFGGGQVSYGGSK